MAPRPIAEGLFTEEAQPHLVAGRCRSCGVVTFPRQDGCPRCTQRDVVDHQLPATGVLWSWTVQRFEPKRPYRGPSEFVPYGVGYVEYPGECIVEGRLTTAEPADLRIGAPMRLTLIENHRDANDDVVLTYAFTPGEEPA